MPDLAPRPEELEPTECTSRTATGSLPAGWANVGARALQLGGLVKDSIGVTVAVEVTEPGLVERSLGKAQRVVDLREPT